MTGKLKIKGNLMLATKLDELISVCVISRSPVLGVNSQCLDEESQALSILWCNVQFLVQISMY